MSKSLKINYIFNLINTVSGLLFPLITFPYASRVMMADGIGHVNFYQSIIQYITLLSCLGIPMYAIREIAKVRDNIEERNKTAIEILILHAILTSFGYLFVAIIANTVTEVMVDIPLFLILSLTIFFTAIGCEWFYQGIEDFKYITLRGIIVKIISVILLFLLVKTKDDLYWYAGYSVFGVLGGNIFNFFKLRLYIPLNTVNIKELRPLRHLLPALHIFALNLITSIYLQLNSVMLGFMADDTSVGLFTAASKLTHMLLGISSSLATTMLPRMSNLLSNGLLEEFNANSRRAMQFMVAIALPMTAGLFCSAQYLIPLFSGETYFPAIRTLQILSPIILFISMGCVMGMQTLFPLGKTNIVIFATGIGAIVNVILNLILIPSLKQDGAAMATSIAELTVTISMYFIGKKYLAFNLFSKSYICYIIATILMIIVILFLPKTYSGFINLIINVFSGLFIYSIVLYLLKESMFIEIINIIAKKLNIKRI